MIFIFIIIVLTIMGICFLSIGITRKNNRNRLHLKCTSKTKAVFDKLDEFYYPEEADRKTFLPNYKYYVDKTEYKIVGFGQAKEEDVNKEDIEVYYNPTSPQEAYIANDISQNTGLEKLFIILGASFLSIGIILTIVFFAI